MLWKYLQWIVIYNAGYAVGIFLFEIENTQSKSTEDNLIWVNAGDFPPMYLDTFNVSTTKQVVDTYIDLGNMWIEMLKLGIH